MAGDFKSDIQAMYQYAESCGSLGELVPQLYRVLRGNSEALRGVSYAYRLVATDTGYQDAFSLRDGAFAQLAAADAVDVTVLGSESNLLAVFQRKLNPMTGLLLRKLRVEGSKAALMKLASFL